jgi:hypothetical protein
MVGENEMNTASWPMDGEHEPRNLIEAVTLVPKWIRVAEVLVHEFIRGWSQLSAKGVDVGRTELE